MDIVGTCKILGSRTRLNIIKILAESRRLSSIKIYEIYNNSFDDKKKRESIYRSLEQLVGANILGKIYDKSDKELKYFIINNRILIDLLDQTIEMLSTRDDAPPL